MYYFSQVAFFNQLFSDISFKMALLSPSHSIENSVNLQLNKKILLSNFIGLGFRTLKLFDSHQTSGSPTLSLEI